MLGIVAIFNYCSAHCICILKNGVDYDQMSVTVNACTGQASPSLPVRSKNGGNS